MGRGAWAVVAAAALGCSREHAPASESHDTATATPGPALTAHASSFREFALAAVDSLRPLTYGQWLATHPGEQHPSLSRVYASAWCALTAARATLPGGEVVQREAFFYPSAPPEDYAPDIPDSAVNMERDCVLGMVVVGVESLDASDQLIDTLARDLQSRLGGEAVTLDTIGGLAANLPHRWRSSRGIMGAGHLVVESDDPMEDADTVRPSDVTVMAALPMVESLLTFAEQRLDTEAWQRRVKTRLATTADAASRRDLMHGATIRHRPRSACDDENIDSLRRAEESFLAAAADSEVSAAAHFVIAHTLADRLDVNAAIGDPTRREAIAHLRATLTLDRGRHYPYGRLAAFDLWRLLAGLQPYFTFFYLPCD